MKWRKTCKKHGGKKPCRKCHDERPKYLRFMKKLLSIAEGIQRVMVDNFFAPNPFMEYLKRKKKEAK